MLMLQLLVVELIHETELLTFLIWSTDFSVSSTSLKKNKKDDFYSKFLPDTQDFFCDRLEDAFHKGVRIMPLVKIYLPGFNLYMPVS